MSNGDIGSLGGKLLERISSMDFPRLPSPTVLSFVALGVSVASLVLASHLAWRDRSRIVAESFARAHERTGDYASVFVTVTNAGRRPANLRHLWGLYEDGSQSCQYILAGGLKLQEGEFHELEFGKFDGIMVNGEEMSGLIEVFLEDSSGKKHKIKDARKNVKLVRESNHPLGVKTHG